MKKGIDELVYAVRWYHAKWGISKNYRVDTTPYIIESISKELRESISLGKLDDQDSVTDRTKLQASMIIARILIDLIVLCDKLGVDIIKIAFTRLELEDSKWTIMDRNRNSR